MAQTVVIKSNRHGFKLILSPEPSFPELLDGIMQKFEESAKFFKDAKMAISFSGRELSQDEELQIIDAITEHTDIQILCVVDEDITHTTRTKQLVDDYYNGLIGKEGDIYRGTLQDGQQLSSSAGITIVGDVMPGAVITAVGNVIVLGTLYGTAVAGAFGNTHSFIAAMEMEPTKLTIAGVTTEYGERKVKKKGLLRKEKNAAPVQTEVQMATLYNDAILVQPVPKNVFTFIE